MRVFFALLVFWLMARAGGAARAAAFDLANAESYPAAPLHERPSLGSLADTIPFFWQGEYHIFYLRAGLGHIPWEHIVSRDLVHWRQLPSAILPDGAPDSPDAGDIGTGSVCEHDGIFHLFYTGANPHNPRGHQCIMHATSEDLVTWTKHPELALYGDGATYQSFRDPFVFWNEEAKSFWMVLCAFDAGQGRPLQGLAQSDDLTAWKQVKPLIDDPAQTLNPECPDLFKIGGTWYLIRSVYNPATATGATTVLFAPQSRGPYRPSPSPDIDTTILYAAKSMFDGRRRVITGWIRDLGGHRDGGVPQFGGDQCLPREVYAGPEGQLYFRPVPEVVAPFDRVMFSSRQEPALKTLSSLIATPADYLLEAKARLESGATLTVAMRQGEGSGYRLVLRAREQEGEIDGPRFSYRRKIAFDVTQPVKIQAFVLGSIIECFVDDEYAFSCRAYDDPTGGLRLTAEGGAARILELAVKTQGRPAGAVWDGR